MSEYRSYTEQMTVLDGDSDFRRCLKPSALFRYVEQVSADHARAYGMDHAFFIPLLSSYKSFRFIDLSFLHLVQQNARAPGSSSSILYFFLPQQHIKREAKPLWGYNSAIWLRFTSAIVSLPNIEIIIFTLLLSISVIFPVQSAKAPSMMRTVWPTSTSISNS